MRYFCTLISLVITLWASAQDLVIIHNQDSKVDQTLFNQESIRIHFYNNNFSIATALDEYNGDRSSVIFSDPWQPSYDYLMVRLPLQQRNQYLNFLQKQSERIYIEDDLAFVEIAREKVANLRPAVHGGLVRLAPVSAKLPKTGLKQYDVKSLEVNPLIEEAITKVDPTAIETSIQHLQDYGTRNCKTPQAIEAQNWIKEQYEAMGLEVELMDFPIFMGESSDNVIAVLPGETHPEEFVVCGGHYDSITYDDEAPGADDNASGTVGIMEIAKILKDYHFKKSIVFCAFSGEEYGLYGSEGYASWADDNNKNILGYFNMDMVAYRNGTDPINSTMIAPSTAQDLANFYKEVCGIYLPDFQINTGQLSGGDSDHTSFNNHGFQGIFPFEDIDNYSPYIHTSNDILGTSANSMEMAGVFTQATLASVATMAEIYDPTGLSDNPGQAISLYPNPTTERFFIRGVKPESNIHYTIRNIAGQLMDEGMATDGTIQASTLENGLYFVELRYDGYTTVRKILLY